MQWFRWYHGTCADPKFGSIARKARSTRERALAVWAMLLESASESDERGAFAIDADGIADVLNCDTESIAVILSEMETRGMIRKGRVTAFERRNFMSDNSSDRVRKHREKRRNGDVTPIGRYSNADVTPPETDTEAEAKTETAKPPKGARQSAPTEGAKKGAKGESAPWMGKMAKVWRDAYGGNPPSHMAKALRPAVRELGEDVVAERLAVYCGQTGATFTNLHKFAATIGMWTPEQRGGVEEREHPEEARLRAFAEEHRRKAAEDDAWMMERLREKGYLPKVAA